MISPMPITHPFTHSTPYLPCRDSTNRVAERCTMYIRCYKASLCERTLLVVQEGTVGTGRTSVRFRHGWEMANRIEQCSKPLLVDDSSGVYILFNLVGTLIIK